MRISDWSSDVCSSDLWPDEIRFLCSTPITHATGCMLIPILSRGGTVVLQQGFNVDTFLDAVERYSITTTFLVPTMIYALTARQKTRRVNVSSRSEEHTSELQSLMRISYAVFCLKKKNINKMIEK